MCLSTESDCRLSSSIESLLADAGRLLVMQPLIRPAVLLTLLLTLLPDNLKQADGRDPRRTAGRATRHTTETPARRAGYPKRIAPWATTWPNRKTRGYYVGGGAALFGFPASPLYGEGRRSSEGTFGVDYMPWYSNYSQHWYHGQNQQGGEGQYEADHRVHPLEDFWGFGPRRPPLRGKH